VDPGQRSIFGAEVSLADANQYRRQVSFAEPAQGPAQLADDNSELGLAEPSGNANAGDGDHPSGCCPGIRPRVLQEEGLPKIAANRSSLGKLGKQQVAVVRTASRATNRPIKF
jgi:hypothetical protein